MRSLSTKKHNKFAPPAAAVVFSVLLSLSTGGQARGAGDVMLTAQVELAPGYLDMDDPKVLSALGSISCGDNLAAVQYQLIVEDCAGMTRSYYSSKTTLRHLTQGCAFHTTMPDGSEYVVKRVFARPPTEDGRPKFIDRSRLGVLRANGMVEASSTSPVVTFADVPIDCPPIR